MKLPSSLVTSKWLEQHLSEEKLRVLDVTAKFAADEKGNFEMSCGREDYEKAHIPGAQFADLLAELSEPNAPLLCTFPSAEQFSAAMEKLGIGDDCAIIVYCNGIAAFATRVWFLLRAFGFNNVAVLDGGLDKWLSENRPVNSGIEPVKSASTSFTARLNRELLASKEDILAEINKGNDSCVLLDSLPKDYFHGKIGDVFGYGRPGHIAGAINLSYEETANPETGEYRPAEDFRKVAEKVVPDPNDKIITYCGAGIGATQNMFALHLIGYNNVSLYDGSLQEWAADESLPMET